MINDIRYQETRLQDTIERILFIRDDRVAVAYIDETIPDFILAWPLRRGRSYAKVVGVGGKQRSRPLLTHMLEMWLFDVMPSYNSDPALNPVQLEYWLAGSFFERKLTAPIRVDQILAEIFSKKILPSDELNLLLLNINNNVLEVVFEKDVPIQCACTLKGLIIRTFTPFFQAFHSNYAIFADPHLSLKAFHADPNLFPNPLNLVGPAPVLP